MSDSDDSVTAWIHQLGEGDQLAQTRIWEKYGEVVQRMARRFLPGVHRRDSDEEDIAIQVLNNLYIRMANGEFEGIETRRQFWALLLGMTRKKAAEEVRKKRAEKRGAGKVRGESAFFSEDDSGYGIEQVAEGGGATFPKVPSEQISELVESLDRDDLRQVVLLRMAGHSNNEIAKRLGVSERTVDRLFKRVRQSLRLNEA